MTRTTEIYTLSLHDALPIFYRDWNEGCYLFFPRILQPGETVKVTFTYRGGIAERSEGEFFVTAGDAWYPRTGGSARATYRMQFVTPKQFPFVASGNRISSVTEKDSVVSTWDVAAPAQHVSFAIGAMERFDFADSVAGPIEVYYSRKLHDEIAGELVANLEPAGRYMDKQVAGDVINSIRLYRHFFGDPPFERQIGRASCRARV